MSNIYGEKRANEAVEKSLALTRDVWGFEGRRTKDKWGRDYILENQILLRRCKMVLQIQTNKKIWFPHVRIIIGSVHGKYAYGIRCMGKTGGGWGTGYHPSLHSIPYNSCKDAKRAGLITSLESWKRHNNQNEKRLHSEDKLMIQLLEEELGPQQLNLF